MNTLAETILEHTQALPEGATACAKELLHLGNRAAVDQALSRLARRGHLMRIGRGVYVRPIEGRFGKRSPSESRVLENFARATGEQIAPHGAAAANKLGLTTQVPVRSVYLTSGRNRRLKLGSQEVELRHAPTWQFVVGNKSSGEVLRALAWLGPEQAGTALRTLKPKLSKSEMEAIASVRPVLPAWLAKEVSDAVVNG